MWCPDDIGRDSWDWVGPPTKEVGMIQLPGVECRERERNVPRLDYCCRCSIFIVIVEVIVLVVVGGRFGETTFPPKMIRVVACK